jgi:DNA-binding transcriptional regulator LsrR (DeoR family)
LPGAGDRDLPGARDWIFLLLSPIFVKRRDREDTMAAAIRRRNLGRVSGENAVIEVAWMYYHDGRNQQDIAESLGISRATVVNTLQQARETGLIRITLAAPAFTAHRLSLELRAAFGLAEAFVVPDEGLPVEDSFTRVVRGAALWLPELLGPGDRLGVAWGRTVYELAERVEAQEIENLTVLQLVGSMATPYGFTAEACSTRLAQRLGARCLNLHAPAVLSRAALAEELREEPILKAQLQALQGVNKLLFSAGTVAPDSHVVSSGLASPEDLAAHVARGAVAVICGRFVDARGREMPGPTGARMIGIDLARLVGLETGLLIVPGLDKVTPSLAAIHGGYVTHLATSSSVAEALLAQV